MSEIKILSADEIAIHNKKSDLWVIVSGKVYDVTKFVDEHPGGEEVLLESAGMDCTEAFEDVGHSEEAREMLNDYYVGDLAGSSEPAGPPKFTSTTSAQAATKTANPSSEPSLLQYVLPVAIVAVYLAYKMYA
ncbi:hypothetical protein H4R34_004265 [Dimargaris verticillata]|uniref:Cytochrome b5 heme-binding domain-containing protein n=1 Tax=Dimargaris verticillata TaxID=2761393 RepID=A0A9W8EBB0_9FUNG|nr:hypothetical protein H4R34_004265 [Dimargaris verticillata]